MTRSEQRFKAILFDFDGLILDTETPIFQAWQEKFQEYGQVLRIEEWAMIIGRSGDNLGPVEEFLKIFPEGETRSEVLEEVSRREWKRVQLEKPLPGVEELLLKSRSAGLKLGIVSSSDRKWVESHLERLELRTYFDHISTADDVENAKPDPALYRLGLERSGKRAEKVLVVEDSPNGVLAAKRAGLYCIAIPNSITRQLPFSKGEGKPDLVLESLEQFPWEELMKGTR